MDALQGRLTQKVGKEAYIERLGGNIVVLLPPVGRPQVRAPACTSSCSSAQ